MAGGDAFLVNALHCRPVGGGHGVKAEPYHEDSCKPASALEANLLRENKTAGADRRPWGHGLENAAVAQNSDLAATPTAVIGPWSLKPSVIWSTFRRVPCAWR